MLSKHRSTVSTYQNSIFKIGICMYPQYICSQLHIVSVKTIQNLIYYIKPVNNTIDFILFISETNKIIKLINYYDINYVAYIM